MCEIFVCSKHLHSITCLHLNDVRQWDVSHKEIDIFGHVLSHFLAES